MKIVETVKEMQEIARKTRGQGKRIVLVPTMGFLHEGHASLMREGRKRGDLLVTSIFVNPTQFGAGEDFDSYPRDLERDSAIAESAGVDLIFAPKASDMYPAGYQTWVDVDRMTLPLCGKSRPGHFRGVTTVVTKLFNIVMPHTALFGNKDFQQLAVLRRMTSDLNMDVEIIGMPIVREVDGLAMSSRNSYLSDEERISALCLSKAVIAVRDAFAQGTTSVNVLREIACGVISGEPAAAIDYVEILDGDTLNAIDSANARTVMALAVRIGKTRLIDNTILGEEM